jgi:hypothetical protein
MGFLRLRGRSFQMYKRVQTGIVSCSRILSLRSQKPRNVVFGASDMGE